MGSYKKTKFDEEQGVIKSTLCCCGLCYCSKTQKRLCLVAVLIPILVILSLFMTILIKTFTVQERFILKTLSEDDVVFINPGLEEKQQWIENLGGSVQIPTVSWNDTYQNTEELAQMSQYLRETFPSIFSCQYIQVFTINTYSLLLRIEGTKVTKNPYLLASHFDVVPPGDQDRWDYDPFLGDIIEEDGESYIYGRGSIDDKHSVMGILQALDWIVSNNSQPERTFYIGFGHDEEIGGEQGAANIAQKLESLLREHNEELDFLLDEGMTVMHGVVPGVSDPVIYIGVVEKGWAMLELSVIGDQKHSSTPPRHSAPGILSGGLSKLEKHRSPSKFGEGPEIDTMSYLAPYMSFIYKLALSNLWMFKDIVSSFLANDENIDAIQRTTTAITIIQAGFKENVVPGEAKAIVNHRIHPSETIDDILKHDKKVIDDNRVEIKTLGYKEPPPVSPYSNDATPFQIIANSALQIFPDGHITPGILVANTDTKHYLHLTNNVYRFTPAFTTKNDISRFHGFNERISTENYAQVVEFYHRLIRNSDTKIDEDGNEASGDISDDMSGSGDIANFDVNDYQLLPDLE